MSSPDELPPALSSMWRLCRLGYRHEPGLLLAAFLLSLFAALPDALIAVWLKLLGEGVLRHDRGAVLGAAAGLAASATASWYLRVVGTRLGRDLFVTATTGAPRREVRLTGIGDRLVGQRRTAWERWYALVSRARWGSAGWHTLAWAVFGAGYVGAIVFVASGLHASAGNVLLVLAAGARLSAYVGATVGEIGFLRGIWMDGARRLAWLEDYAAALVAPADLPVPDRLTQGIRLEHVSFAYPGTERLVLEDVSLDLPAGAVVAIVGENGAGKSTLVKLLCKLYVPTSGTILVDGVDLARLPSDGWRARLAGAFQDFFRFELPARQSVGLGDVPRLDDDIAVRMAVDRAGAAEVVERFADGLDTQLGVSW